MFRSEYAHQRVLAARMLSGIMLRRDCIVALEAYSQVCTGDSEDAIVVEDELGHKSSVFSKLSACFEHAVARFQAHFDIDPVSARTQLIFYDEPRGALTSMESVSEMRIRKLMTWCFLHLLAASDLPVELPTLFLWALSSSSTGQHQVEDDADTDAAMDLPMSFGSTAPRNNPATAKISLLRCLQLYLTSPVEEACIDLLQRRSVLWSAYGCPRLPTPHTRRTDAYYEQYMHDCASRAREFLRSEDELAEEQGDENANSNRRTPESVREAFALQCRWSRISAIVSRSSVVSQLASHAEVAMDAAIAAKWTKAASSGSSGIIQAYGTLSMDLLMSLIRQGEDEVVQAAYRKFFVRTWRKFALLSDSCRDTDAQSCTAVLRRQWLRMMVVLVPRSRQAAQLLFEANGEWTYSTLLAVLVRPSLSSSAPSAVASSDADVALAMHLLTAGLVYGWGLRSVAELLLAVQVNDASFLEHSSGNRISTLLDRGTPLFLLLEQASVACSAVFATSGEVESQEAVQTSSCILAFVKRHWVWLELQILSSESCLLRSAILSFLCSIFPSTGASMNDTQSLPAMAREVVNKLSLRGKGLMRSVWGFTDKLVKSAGEQQGGGSVTATALHLRGQSQDLLDFACRQASFDDATLSSHVEAAMCAAISQSNSSRWMEQVEHALHLQRFSSVVAHAQLARCNDSIAARCIVDSCVSHMNTCCQIMGVPSRLFSQNESAQLSNKGDHAQEGGGVSSGVFMWHVQRLQQAALVLQAQFVASVIGLPLADATLIREAQDALVTLLATHLVNLTAHSLSAALETLFGASLKYLLGASDSANPAVLTKEELGALSTDIFKKVLGVPMCSDVNDSNSRPTSLVLEGQPPRTHTTEWLTLRGADQVPGKVLSLQPNWAFLLLGGDIAGPSLAAWLCVLESLSSTSQSTTDSNELSNQLYLLMKLSTSDQAHKWYTTDSVEEGESMSCYPAAVGAYRGLVLRILQRSAEQRSTSFTAEFCAVVSKDFFNTTGMVSKFLRKEKSATRKLAGEPAAASLEGLLDLCDKALDAALNQAIDADVHSVVLTVLASPCMPWAVRLRVWAAVGSVRLVHLLEDRVAIQSLMPALLRPALLVPQTSNGSHLRPIGIQTESLALYTEIVAALIHLRSDSDRQWCIVAVTVFQIARFVFVGEQESGGEFIKPAVRGQAAHLLDKLFKVAQSEEDRGWWILQAVLDMAVKVPSVLAGRAPTDALNAAALEDILATCTSSCKCTSLSELWIPVLLREVMVECGATPVCTLAAFSSSYC